MSSEPPAARLEGKVALVTGASRPRGMGWASALKLAESGADVVVSDRVPVGASESRDLGLLDGAFKDEPAFAVEKALSDLVTAIEQRGRRAIAAPLDVTDRNQIAAAVERAVETFGGLDILFNNAGNPWGTGPFQAMTADQWQGSFDVNVTGMFNTCQLVVPEMLKRGGGSIVNNASDAGLKGYVQMAGYCASKFAVVGLTLALAQELAPQGIRCNVVCPGWIDTDMGDLDAQFNAAVMKTSVEEAKRQIVSGIPLGRLGQADDVADMVTFLAGPESRFVTGLAVPVAGGVQ